MPPVYHTIIFFPIRVVNGWNELPYDLVNVNSINLFKAHLDRFYYDFECDIV